MLLVALLLLSANLNMPKTVGAKDKNRCPQVSGSCRSGAPAGPSCEECQRCRQSIRGAFTQGGPAPTLAPAPAPETIAPVPGSSDAGDGEAAAPPPSVTDDAFAAEASGAGQQVAAAAAAPVVNDAVAASCLRASSRSWINHTPKHDDPGASSEV